MSMFTGLVLGLICLAGIRDVTAFGNVGCFFDKKLCLQEEYCHNDKIFGRCRVRGSPANSETPTGLMWSSRSLLEHELKRLLAGGYRWSHQYTQCVVQNLIDTESHSLKYDPGVCSRLLQLTLPEVNEEIERDLESIGPDEQAMIKFRPSTLEDHPEFADEVYTPRTKGEGEEVKEELEEGTLRLGQLLTKRSRQGRRDTDIEQDPDPYEDSDLGDFPEPLRDAWYQITGHNTRNDRLPDPEAPVIRTDLSSDLTRRPAYSEGGVQWLPISADEATEEIQARTPFPSQDKQVAPPTDSADKLSTQDRQPDFPSTKPDGAMGREHSQIFSKDVNTHKEAGSTSGRSSLSLTKASAVTGEDMVQAEPETEDLWRPLVDDEEDSYQENGDALPPEMVAFSRPMRYDIKKPGPGYYVHEPEDDTPQAQEKQMLALLRSAQREKETGKWKNFAKTSPDGASSSPSSPASTPDLINDEEATLQDLVKEGDPISYNYPRLQEPKDGDAAFEEDKREQIPFSGNSHEKPAELMSNNHKNDGSPQAMKHQMEQMDNNYAYLLLQETDSPPEAGERLVRRLERLLSLPRGTFSDIRTDNDRVSFKVNSNAQHLNASTVAKEAEMLAEDLKRNEGLTVLAAGTGDKAQLEIVRQVGDDRRLFIITFIVCGSVAGILLAVSVVFLVRKHARTKQKLQSLSQPDSEPSHDYQDLCRQRMQRQGSEKTEPAHRPSLPGGGSAPTHQQPKRVSSLSQSENSQATPSSRSSTSSWSEEPVTSNMDISTGHMILSYMEDHLNNRDRLEREWQALCAYEADPCDTLAAAQTQNTKKNRYSNTLPYDHSRVVLNDVANISGADYINASTITDHDPRNPAYIATQGPLASTAADFWQMIWEQGSVVVVTLSRLMENGVALCHRYWPEEGSEVYHIYEVHLVSEHIWCDDYLVRSFYLKNVKTSETRTVTQFHFLSWPENGVPASVKALLEFRRKVNKSYRGRSCPIVVHCSDGCGRTGTYCLIDMVLNRMAKGAKEIDIAATLEHIRDQRDGMVKTQAQFEFVLMAIAEEVHAILKALSN